MSVKVSTVIEEEFFSDVYVSVGVDSNPVVAPHHKDLHLAVWLARVISEPNLATQPSCVNAIVLVEIEHVRTLCFVVHLASSLGLILCYHFADILRDELVFHCLLADIRTPAGNIARSNIHFLPQSSL